MWVSTCSVLRATYSTDGYSSATASYTTIASSVRCDVQSRSRSETDEFGKTTARTMYRVFFAAGSDVLPRDRLSITSGQFAGKTLEIRSYAGNQGGHGSQLALDAEEVEGAP